MDSAFNWFAITVIPKDKTVSGDLFDAICLELVDLGAAGTSVDRAPEITCYLEGAQSKIDAFIQALPSIGCSLVSQNRIKEENWTGSCPEVWEPITAGSLQIVPVESLTDPRPCPPDAIKIIPGLGFGTGHHVTTRMVLTALTKLVAETPPGQPHSILDLGTGSGILAIAAARLLDTPVLGTDIDAGAIDNARDNIALNQVQDLVTVSTTPIQELKGPYNLILANLYGEVLMNLAHEVTRVADTPTTAILSGITEIVWDQVWERYSSAFGWRLVSEISDNGWICAVIER